MSLAFLLNLLKLFGVLNITRDGNTFRTSKLCIALNVLKALAVIFGKEHIYRYSLPASMTHFSPFMNFVFATQMERKFYSIIVIILFQILTSGYHVNLLNQMTGLHEALRSQADGEASIRNRNVQRLSKIVKVTWFSYVTYTIVMLAIRVKAGNFTNVLPVFMSFLLLVINLAYSSLFFAIIQFLIYSQECLMDIIKRSVRGNKTSSKEAILMFHSEIFELKKSFQKLFSIPLATVLTFHISQIVLQVKF
jgi:7tm Chemosensory receptor